MNRSRMDKCKGLESNKEGRKKEDARYKKNIEEKREEKLRVI